MCIFFGTQTTLACVLTESVRKYSYIRFVLILVFDINSAKCCYSRIQWRNKTSDFWMKRFLLIEIHFNFMQIGWSGKAIATKDSWKVWNGTILSASRFWLPGRDFVSMASESVRSKFVCFTIHRSSHWLKSFKWTRQSGSNRYNDRWASGWCYQRKHIERHRHDFSTSRWQKRDYR